MSDNKTATALEVEGTHAPNTYDAVDEKAKISDFRAGAMDAENAELAMGTLEALKAYPTAAMWAFIMSCTIVSGCLVLRFHSGN